MKTLGATPGSVPEAPFFSRSRPLLCYTQPQPSPSLPPPRGRGSGQRPAKESLKEDMSQPRPPPPLCGRVDLSRGGQSFPTLLNSNPDAQASRSQCRGDAWKPQTQRPVLFRLREDGAPQNAEECVSGVRCLNPGSGT